MAPIQKPRRRSGYSHEQTALVESACLSVAATLGALMDDVCIVGGLVPTLLARDFETPETLGPARVADFEQASSRPAREVAADAHGDVDDLLVLCRLLGLL